MIKHKHANNNTFSYTTADSKITMKALSDDVGLGGRRGSQT